MAITETQRDLAALVRDWAAEPERAPISTLGLLGIGLPEARGGSGGELGDLAVAMHEAGAALVPGALLGTSAVVQLLGGDDVGFVAGQARAGVALRKTTDGEPVAVLGADSEAHTLLGLTGDRWYLVPPGAEALRLSVREPVDPSCPVADATVSERQLAPEWLVPDLDGERVRDTVTALACAEASGVAQWCVRTAAEHATVREQFGAPIGKFQAVKQLCATMLCRAETATGVAWDAVSAGAEQPGQRALAVATAAVLCLDAAVDNAKDCIQVLGGIGFTWEHPAHRYLRRALLLREFTGGSRWWRARVHELSAAGTRRALRVDVPVAGDSRARIRDSVGRVAALAPEQQRKALVDSGLLMPHWPAPYGWDAGVAEQLAVVEELERAGVRRPSLVVGGWALATILRHGTEEQRSAFVLPTLLGELSWCQLFSEPEAGSDLAGLRTRAQRTEDGWLLTGQKVWTSNAGEADWAICLARTDPEAPKHKGITFFLVDMRSAGITVRPLREITGEALFNEVFLDGVFVPDSRVVGEVHGGWALTRTTLAAERVAMVDGSTLDDGLERMLAGEADPVLADRIGRLVAEAVAARVLELRATLRSLDGQRSDAESSVLKLIGVWRRQEVAELTLGVAGTSDAEALHEFLLTRCLSIGGGTTQILLNVAAERLLGLPR